MELNACLSLESVLAINEFEIAMQNEKWEESPLGQITKVDDEFWQLEKDFQHRRDLCGDLTFNDKSLLQICRNNLAAKLLQKTDNENVAEYIKKRARFKISFQKILIMKSPLDLLVEKELAARKENKR